MEISKEVLQLRLAGMTPQLGQLLEQAAMVRGAISLCNELMAYLETGEAEPPNPPEPDPSAAPAAPAADESQPAGDTPIEE